MRIEFLLLACSSKKGGRCVAGIDVTNKRLIRLVSRDASSNGAIRKDFCKIDGSWVELLEVVEVELGEKAPAKGAQTENYYVDMPFFIRRIRKGTVDEAKKYMQKGRWGFFPFQTKLPYMYDKAYADTPYSLALIKAYSIQSYQPDPEKYPEKWKVRFKVYSFKGEVTELSDYSCTIPNEEYYKTSFRIGKALMLVSLPGDRDGFDYYHKFIAGIIPTEDSKTSAGN